MTWGSVKYTSSKTSMINKVKLQISTNEKLKPHHWNELKIEWNYITNTFILTHTHTKLYLKQILNY